MFRSPQGLQQFLTPLNPPTRWGNRIAALRLLGQHHGLFSERVEHNHQHHLLIEHAARALDSRLALLTARRAEERSGPQKAEDAEIIEARAA